MFFNKIIYKLRYFAKVILNPAIFSKGSVRIHSGVKILVEANGKIKFGENVILKSGTTIYAKSNSEIIIGDNTSTGHHTEISANRLVVIGNDVIMGAYTYITDSNHGYSLKDIPIRNQPMETGSVFIGNNVWLGRNAMILKGAKLDDDIIVGAGAVVAKHFGKGSIIGGVPAKLIKSIHE